LYFGEPDASGHLFGPESEQVKNVVKQLDFVLDYLFTQLKLKKKLVMSNLQRDHFDNSFRSINLIILTDHGMQTIKTTADIDLNRLLVLGIYMFILFY
jgi:predicted AlkP superfamily pyrophosphatase or phosphodiesterase